MEPPFKLSMCRSWVTVFFSLPGLPIMVSGRAVWSGFGGQSLQFFLLDDFFTVSSAFCADCSAPKVCTISTECSWVALIENAFVFMERSPTG